MLSRLLHFFIKIAAFGTSGYVVIVAVLLVATSLATNGFAANQINDDGPEIPSTPPSFYTNQPSFGIESQYFTTSANFSTNGERLTLPSGYSYTNLRNKLYAKYNFWGDVNVQAGADINYASSSDSITDRTNSKITNVFLSSEKLFEFGELQVIPIANLVYSLEKIDLNTDEVLTSEGAHILSLGSWISYPVAQFKPYGFLNYQYRSDGKSSLLEFKFGALANFSRWSVNADIGGYNSVTDDKYTATPFNRTSVTNKVNGGSLKYNSANPSVLEVSAGAGYLIPFSIWRNNNSATITAGLTHVLSGKNTAAGETFLLGFKYDLDSTEPTSNTSSSQKSTTSKRKSSNRKSSKTKDKEDFVPATEENYDPSIFKED